ncbi:MAG: outer membrane protein assembly factor BamA [Bacteroidota bacterium]
MKRGLQLLIVLMLSSLLGWSQSAPNQNEGESYLLSGIDVEGATFSDKSLVISLTGLKVGEVVTVPGLQISDAIKRLWKENIFSDISIRADKIVGDKIWLVVVVKERPRISQFSFQGISKSQADELREKINFIRGTILTDSKKQTAKRVIRNFYVEKGFYNTSVDIIEEIDKVLRNGVVVNIKVNKGNRVRIEEIVPSGNTAFNDKKFKRKLKKFHQKTWWRFWARSKYVPKQYREAKDELMMAYRTLGYRDATIERDTVYKTEDGFLRVEIQMDEGQQYFHRNIEWSGNYKYDASVLGQVLSIKKGDIYSKDKVDARLFGDPQGGDVSSLYLDNGYLFFNLEPVEVAIVGDSIDLEMRVREGPQASIRKVPIAGNTKTSDFVVRRELRTSPGAKFSRSDIIRSQRQVLALNYFDQENMGVNPAPNPTTGTVDINYTLEERPSDQLQLQGGWGQPVRDGSGSVLFGGFVGTVQLAFNNFASKRILQADQWRPVPSGDGQRVSLSFQMNGANYKQFAFNFMEPWVGGKRPNSLGLSTSYFVTQSVRNGQIVFRNSILSTSLDYGRRLKFPDDFFTSRTSIGYKYYDILNPENWFNGFEGEERAFINLFTLRQSIDRSSVDAPIYPRSGSIMSLSVEATPPYSLFDGIDNYSDIPDTRKYNLLEYHKWRFNSNWFFRLVDNLVLSAKVEAGYLGAYNPQYGLPPFERFYLGGAGIGALGFAGFDGKEYIALRGYEDQSLNNADVPNQQNQGDGYPIYNRMVLEFRYPISLNQSAPVWVQAFLEGGNGYETFREYNPFNLRRSAGVGLRAMLPMVGLLGLDWAWGFDRANDLPGPDPGISGSQFHFIIGQNF